MTSVSRVIEEICEGVVRIPLPIPLRDLREVNCYVIADDSGPTLVDPGWYDESSENELRRGLASLGLRPDDVRQIVVTHSHWDHYTRALAWRARYGTPVHLGIEERHTIDAFDLADGSYPQQVGLLRRAGAEQLAERVDRLPIEGHERDQPFGPPTSWVADQQIISCGGHALRAQWTPGHTRGHVVYELLGSALMFTGDHLLPRITPSLGFERAPEDSPLTSYLDSLTSLVDRPGLQMLPAHGAPSQSVDARARELLDHHRVRCEEIRGLVVRGFRTACDVAEQMTWTRHGYALHDLGEIHEMTAILEVRAHLEHMVRTGVLAKTSGAVDRYRHVPTEPVATT